jgi:hypothetical protein
MAEVKMYQHVLEEGLSYGQAMDRAIIDRKKVTRAIWGGYWELQDLPGITTPTLVATLKDNGGTTTATAYAEDKVAMDWMVVK